MEDNRNYFFLKPGGRSAEILRQKSWDNHPLGTPENWPQSLKNSLATVFYFAQPTILYWGTENYQFYNDACLPILNDGDAFDMHFGNSAQVSVIDQELDLSAVLNDVKKTGNYRNDDNIIISYSSSGQRKEISKSISFSPIFDDLQSIGGVIAIYFHNSDSVFTDELQKSQQEFEFAINAAELGTFDLDPIRSTFSANSRLKDWFGMEPNEHIPLDFALKVIADDDRERVVKAITDALDYEKKSEYECEYTIINPKTNEKRIVFAKGRAEFNEFHETTRFSGTVQDITAYKKANEEVLKARALTELAITNMGIGVFTSDLTKKSLEYSPEFAYILTGNRLKNLQFSDIEKYIHPDDLHLHKKVYKNDSVTGNINYTGRVVWDDGSIHGVKIAAVRIGVDSNDEAFSGTAVDITQKELDRIALVDVNQRLEETRRETYAIFENVTNSSPTGLWLSDEFGNLTYLNKILVDWTGLEYDELLRDGWANAIIEEDRTQTYKIFADCIANRSHYDVLFRIKKGNGDIIWVRSAGDPFYNQAGDYVGYAGFCMDMNEIITGRKALADSEQRFSLMIEQSPLAMCLFTGMNMNIEIVNDAMLGYWKRDRSVIGLELNTALPELQSQSFLQLLQKVYITGEKYTAIESPAQLLVNGELKNFYFDYTYKPIRDSQGVIYGIMNVAHDVTDRVLYNQKLREAQTALSGAIELAGLATWKLSVEKEEISFSERFMNWLGISEEIVPHHQFYDLILESHRYIIRQAIDHAIAKKSDGFFDLEFPIRNISTSQVRIVHASAQIIYNNEGNPEFLSGTAQDVTKEKKLQEELKFKVKERTAELRKVNNELEINNQELQQFAYIASHDLQEPVRKITVFMQMVENYMESNPEKAKSYIDKINSSTKRMTNLIKDVLGFSELAKTSRVYEKTDLNQMVRHVLNDFDLIMEQRDAKITYNDLPTVEAIPLQMSQLFGNLISNALKYSKSDVAPIIQIYGGDLPDDRKSKYEIDQNVSYYQIDIKDNGIGFDQKYADQIFNIFQRLHGKDEFAGTGIGLAMCRKIMQNHNGDIVAKSQEGIGTTFSIIIPKTHEKR